MRKYWGKQIVTKGRFLEVGQKQKREKKKKKRRPKVGNNNGQLRIVTPTRLAHAKSHLFSVVHSQQSLTSTFFFFTPMHFYADLHIYPDLQC